MLQGALYADELDAGGRREGGHVQARWRRALGDGSSIEVQSYYSSEQRDAALRATPGTFDSLATWDISVNTTPSSAERIRSSGARAIARSTASSSTRSIRSRFDEPQPDARNRQLFVQDEIALRQDLALMPALTTMRLTW